jgi:hypothetical protein
MSDSDDIDDVIHQEKGRGRNWPSGKDAIQAHRKWVQDCKNILLTMEWEEVVTALGLRPKTKAYDDYRQIWRAYRSDCDGPEKRPRRPKP